MTRSIESLKNELEDYSRMSTLAAKLLESAFTLKDRSDVEKIKKEADDKVAELELQIAATEPKFP